MEGFVGWPEDVAARYRASGLWEGVTIGEMFARSARRSPDKLALVHGEQRLTYAVLLARSGIALPASPVSACDPAISC